MIIRNIGYHQNVFFELNKFRELNGVPVFLKLEGFNLSGSIKLKPAIFMIQQMEAKGIIHPKLNSIIESSSGNLAKALAQICHSKGYKFTAVVDQNTTKEVLDWLSLFNAETIVIIEPDANGGYLESRIKKIKEIISKDPNCVWINQYANTDNVDSHYYTTAREIIADFPDPDYVFVGAGTTGTLGGIVKFFSEFHPTTKIVAVDAAGSVTFSKPPSPRFIPGIGTSRKPEISEQLDKKKLHDIIWVSEEKGIKTCYRLLNDYSILVGGSTGSVVAGMLTYANRFNQGDIVICISPDFGHKYMDTVYNPSWVENKFHFTIK